MRDINSEWPRQTKPPGLSWAKMLRTAAERDGGVEVDQRVAAEDHVEAAVAGHRDGVDEVGGG